jgi:ribosomal protein S21
MPEEAQSNAPRRRGRPPGSKNRTRRKRAEGGELVNRLNAMVAQLISENRTLRRQVAKLAGRSKGAATSTVESGLRTISRRVERALGATKTRRRSSTAAPANGRRRKTATRKRRTGS